MISSISIVIPTRNRPVALAQCLAALPEGTRGLEPPEIIIVDDCSSDGTRRVVDAFRSTTAWKVRYLRQAQPRGANAARNAALKIAAGDTIVFLDDDIVVPESWLPNLLAGLSNETPVVSGPVELSIEGPIIGKHRHEITGYLSEILSPPHGLRGEVVPAACNMAAYRWVFERAYFDEGVRPPVEENDWLVRAGVRAAFIPGARVSHRKDRRETKADRMLAGAWRRGSEGGWWLRERLRIPAPERRRLAWRSLQTSMRAFGHAAFRRCWGGVVVGVGELSRALALAGLINRGPRVPQSWR
jgi:glycosyltransferase involved in cell wall biosynthesis